MVSRAVEFLRGGGLNVFVDSQSIAYGTDWRDALIEAIENAERVMLFWTAAAAMSRWVKREWQLALKCGKKVVPTLLDDTPPPPRLARLQAVTCLRSLFPAPVRRPEELIQALAQANDLADARTAAEDGDLAADNDGVQVSTTAHTHLSAGAPQSSPSRLAVIVGSLAVVGLATWLVLVRAPQSDRLPSPSPAASAASTPSVEVPPVVVPASAPSPAASSASAASTTPSPVPAASAPRPKPAPAPAAEPGELNALLEGPSWFLLLAVLIMIGGLALRRVSKRGRARSIVREVYAV